jgi:hypothetical protein
MTITLEVPRPRHRDGKRRADRDRSSCGPAGRPWRRAGGESTGAIAGDAFGPVMERGAA